jgi:hypothetical protein
MTYVSHTVRSLQRDPFPDETIRLVLTVEGDTTKAADDDAVASSVAEAVESLGGEILRDLQFDRILVEIDQTDIDAICSLETTRVLAQPDLTRPPQNS